MSKTKKFNFAVMRSGFGDYWIGGTPNKPNGKSIFVSYEEALERALELNDSIDNADELENVEEEEIELLRKGMERWMINS